MAAVTSAVLSEVKKLKPVTYTIVSHHYISKWWDQIQWCYFLCFFFVCLFLYWVLIQLFHSPLSPSSEGSLVPSVFQPFVWCHLIIQFSHSVMSNSLQPHESPVHHQLPEFTQTQVHRVSDAIQPSHPLSSPSSPPAPNPSQDQGLFQWVNSSHEVAKVLEFQLQHQSFQWIPKTDLLQDAVVEVIHISHIVILFPASDSFSKLLSMIYSAQKSNKLGDST